MSYLKSNLSSSPPSCSGVTTGGSGASSSRAQARDEPLAMSRFISNIMDAMAPSSFTATPSSTLNDWTRPILAPSTSPSQNAIGGPLNREYSHTNNNQFHHRDDSSSSPGTSSTVSITCFRCEERVPTTRCLECNDLFCHDCCHAITSDCQLREHTLLPMQQISPIGVKTNNSVNHDKEFQCEVHPEPIRYYCESCTQLICQECILWIHKDHVCIPIRGAFDTCRLHMLKALESGKAGTKAIKSAIDRAVAISKSYEKESVDVTMKIRRTIRYFVQALESREKELLEKVEKIKQLKLNELSDQMNALRGILAGLAHTNESLVKCLDLEGIDLFVAKEKGMTQIEYFASLYKSLQPKDDNIIFMPPNLDFSEQIKIQGDVMLASAAPVQALQSIHYPVPVPLSNNVSSMPDYSGQMSSRIVNLYDMTSNITNLSLDSYPQRGYGKAILGYSYPITVKYSRNPISGIPLLSFGPEGQEEGEVSRPWGLCVNRDGNILVADRRNNRIQIFSKTGEFQSTFGSKGTGPGEFDLPAGIITDTSGRIIIIDKDNHRVQIFTGAGEYLFMFGSFGKDCGQFQYPWDVAVNSVGNIAVTDTRNHRIQLFTNRGTFITKFVFEGANPTKLLKGPTTPRGICFTTNGNILISDFENHRLIMVDSAMNRVISAVGREGCGMNELNRPSGIVTDDEGRIIVADSKNHRVVVFSPELRYQWSVDLKSPGLDDKDRPSDVALTPEGHVVVLFETLPDTARDIISHGKEYIKVY